MKAQVKVIHWVHRLTGKIAPDIELVDKENQDDYIPLFMLPTPNNAKIDKRTVITVEVHKIDNGD